MGNWDELVGDCIESPVPPFIYWFVASPLEPDHHLAIAYNETKNRYYKDSIAPDPESLILFGYAGNGDQWFYHINTHEIFGCPSASELIGTELFVPVQKGEEIKKAMHNGKPLKYEAYVELVAESYLKVIEAP